MPQTIRNLFKNLKEFEPSAELEVRILSSFARSGAARQAVKRKLFYVWVGLAASFGALVYTLIVFGRAFLQSDFWNLIKLAFSDSGVIASHFGDFSYSLLETLPVLEIFAILVPVFVLMLTLSWYFKFNNNNFKHA